jgi:hypothetical protein
MLKGVECIGRTPVRHFRDIAESPVGNSVGTDPCGVKILMVIGSVFESLIELRGKSEEIRDGK